MDWLLLSLLYVVLAGMLGITTKLALRTIGWPELLVWGAIAYALVATGLAALGGERVSSGPGAAWAAVSGLLAACGLILFSLALRRGDASRVVPVTAAYPLVTALLTMLVLTEHVGAQRIIGTVLVVAGVAFLSRGPESSARPGGSRR